MSQALRFLILTTAGWLNRQQEDAIENHKLSWSKEKTGTPCGIPVLVNLGFCASAYLGRRYMRPKPPAARARKPMAEPHFRSRRERVFVKIRPFLPVVVVAGLVEYFLMKNGGSSGD